MSKPNLSENFSLFEVRFINSVVVDLHLGSGGLCGMSLHAEWTAGQEVCGAIPLPSEPTWCLAAQALRLRPGFVCHAIVRPR